MELELVAEVTCIPLGQPFQNLVTTIRGGAEETQKEEIRNPRKMWIEILGSDRTEQSGFVCDADET